MEQLNELSQKLDSAINEQNALALAALFTRDAVWVTPHGIFSGQGAIEEGLKSEFEQSPTIGHILQTDQLHSMGNEAWSVGQWWKTLRGSSGSVFVSGWSAIIVQEGDAWKFRMLTLSSLHDWPCRRVPDSSKRTPWLVGRDRRRSSLRLRFSGPPARRDIGGNQHGLIARSRERS